MNNINYILVIVLIVFFSYRFYRFYSVKKKIPDLLSKGAIIVDVRSAGEFLGHSNPQSRNIPLDRLSEECSKLDKEKMIILCCASGARSAAAMGILKQKGFIHVMNAGPWTNTKV
ncbi:MAG: rhodanese-like domain-containing protein [Bacteriovorax sp.]|jgi:phage shock protein E|nr:rhodanese-like domain-containing protein [Bacteriovorax sp.]